MVVKTDNDLYLTGMNQCFSKHGLCKTLLVRYEVIHYKHIMTEIFVRNTINLNKLLEVINKDVFSYIEYMTNYLRKLHHFPREYRYDINDIVKLERERFFETIDLYLGDNKCMNNIIALDFDGTLTKKSFHPLYLMMFEKGYNIVITSANPTITEEYFIKNSLPIPKRIYSCKGKKQKLNVLLELNKKYNMVHYIDNEVEYLDVTWIHGLNTWHWIDNKIKKYTLKTK